MNHESKADRIFFTAHHTIESATELLRAMGNEQRLRILVLLQRKEQSVGELNKDIDLSQSALSQHLAHLRHAGLVATRKQSQTVYYRLVSDDVRAIIHELSEGV